MPFKDTIEETEVMLLIKEKINEFEEKFNYNTGCLEKNDGCTCKIQEWLWKFSEDILLAERKQAEDDLRGSLTRSEVVRLVAEKESIARTDERKRVLEREKLVSNIALMTLLIERGRKGDMERLIKEFTARLEALISKAKEEINN